MTSTTRALAYESEKPTILARIRAKFGTFENPLAPRSDFAGYLLAEGVFPLTREVSMGPKDGETPRKFPSFREFEPIRVEIIDYPASNSASYMISNAEAGTGIGKLEGDLSRK